MITAADLDDRKMKAITRVQRVTDDFYRKFNAPYNLTQAAINLDMVFRPVSPEHADRMLDVMRGKNAR